MIDHPDVLSLFTRQFGVASTVQLVALGVSARSVGRARARCSIERVLPGVYRLAGTELSFEGRCMAVLLYFGPAAYLSGVTAAALYGFRSMARKRIEVTVPPTVYVSVPGWIRIRRSAWVEPDDVVTRLDGLRLSSPLRTLFTLAAEFNEHRFERAAEDAWHLGLVSPDQASEYLATVRRSGRRGVARFEAWLDSVAARTKPSQSGLELDVVDAIRRAGLPEPDRQHPLRLLSGELIHIDVAWPAIQFGLEPGHSWWHGGDLRKRADEARDRACAEVGWQVERLDEELRRDLMRTGREVTLMYEARRRIVTAS